MTEYQTFIEIGKGRFTYRDMRKFVERATKNDLTELMELKLSLIEFISKINHPEHLEEDEKLLFDGIPKAVVNNSPDNEMHISYHKDHPLLELLELINDTIETTKRRATNLPPEGMIDNKEFPQFGLKNVQRDDTENERIGNSSDRKKEKAVCHPEVIAKKIKSNTRSKDETYSLSDITFALEVFKQNYKEAFHYTDIEKLIIHNPNCPDNLKKKGIYKRMLDWFHTYEDECNISLKNN